MVVHVSAAGSYASTVVRSEVPLVPPTAYTSLPSDAAASICRGVGMGAPSFQEVPSKISVVFSSAAVGVDAAGDDDAVAHHGGGRRRPRLQQRRQLRPATVDDPPHLVGRNLGVGALGAPAAEHDRGVLPRHRHRVLHRNG